MRGREALRTEQAWQIRQAWRLSNTAHSVANFQRSSQRVHLVFGGDCRPSGDGEHLQRSAVLPNV